MRKSKLTIAMVVVLILTLSMPFTAFAGTEKVISNHLEATFNVIEEVTEANVTNLVELNAAIVNTNIKTINIQNTISANSPVIVNRAVTINGGGKTLEFTGLENVVGTTDDGLIIQAPVTINNLVVNAGLTDAKTWVGTYAIHVYNTSATLNNVTATGGNGGILVNGSTVTLTGAIDVSNNGFGGIESSVGSGLTSTSLTVTGVTFTNKSEAYGLPTIWEDQVTGTVVGASSFTQNSDVKDNQVQYYLVATNAVDPNSNIANVKTMEELKAALANANKSIINITESFNVTEKILVNRPITINGGNNTIAFTGDAAGWQGNYVIHVYSTTGVNISNVKLTGADGALLVNGSEVELTGNIDVTGNEYGGIEVSKGSAVTTEPKLTVTGATFTNISESYGLPTIWEDQVTGKLIANSGQFVSNATVKTGQVQYYIAAKNAVLPVALSWNLDTSTINATVGQEESTTVTATLATGIESVNGRLVIEVTKDGIATSDFEFTSITGGTTIGTPEQNATWLNSTASQVENTLTYLWGPVEGTTFNSTVITDVNFKFNKAGTYKINIYLIEIQ